MKDQDEITTSYTTVTFTDCKGLHEEILKRESLDYQDGWTPRHDFALGLCWGAVIVLACWALL